ncbi:hypothetical protein Q7689_15620, partial [Nocardiopsis tropica]|nr:hypothetical protein [Nocardiopsis tropica]
MTRASEVMNKAALLASDIGAPELAAALCWQQYATFRHAAPLTVAAAILAVQPLVNLGRLAIRTGDPAAAYTLLASLLAASSHEEEIQVLGRACTIG